jgi:hypothetical protein
MIILENWRYLVEFGCLKDTWRLSGNAFGHPNFGEGHQVYTSTPRKFDREKMIVETASGNVYQLLNCAGNEEEEIKYIKEDIDRGSSLVL